MKDASEGIFFYMIFLLLMRKTVKYYQNGFVCLVQSLKNHFIAQSQPNLDALWPLCGLYK
jgi:hypothetical protein